MLILSISYYHLNTACPLKMKDGRTREQQEWSESWGGFQGLQSGDGWRPGYRGSLKAMGATSFFKCHFSFILEYGWFTILSQFQMYSRLIQLQVYIYPFFFSSFSQVGVYRILSRVVSQGQRWRGGINQEFGINIEVLLDIKQISHKGMASFFC